jgi:hypothetical protein
MSSPLERIRDAHYQYRALNNIPDTQALEIHMKREFYNSLLFDITSLDGAYWLEKGGRNPKAWLFGQAIIFNEKINDDFKFVPSRTAIFKPYPGN